MSNAKTATKTNTKVAAPKAKATPAKAAKPKTVAKPKAAVKAKATPAPAKATTEAPAKVVLHVAARKIWDEEMANRAAGVYASNIRPNRAFRRVVLDRTVAEVKVSMSSASTLYNRFKKVDEAANPELGLGRDIVKVAPKAAKPAADKPKAKAADTPAKQTEKQRLADLESRIEETA